MICRLIILLLIVGCRPFEEYACDEINAYNGPNAWGASPFRFTDYLGYDILHVPSDCYYCADQTALFWIECNSDEVTDCMKDCKYCPDYVNKLVDMRHSGSENAIAHYSGNIDSILFDNEFGCCFIKGAINRNNSGTPSTWDYSDGATPQFYDHKMQDINSQDSTYCIF